MSSAGPLNPAALLGVPTLLTLHSPLPGPPSPSWAFLLHKGLEVLSAAGPLPPAPTPMRVSRGQACPAYARGMEPRFRVLLPPGPSPVSMSLGSCPVSRKSQRLLHFCDSTRVTQ